MCPQIPHVVFFPAGAGGRFGLSDHQRFLEQFGVDGTPQNGRRPIGACICASRFHARFPIIFISSKHPIRPHSNTASPPQFTHSPGRRASILIHPRVKNQSVFACQEALRLSMSSSALFSELDCSVFFVGKLIFHRSGFPVQFALQLPPLIDKKPDPGLSQRPYRC
jgi:hypothetical protein